MRSPIPLRLKTLRANPCAPLRYCALLAVFGAALVSAFADSPPPASTKKPATAKSNRAAKAVGSRVIPQAPAAQPAVPAAPAAPPAPVWPVNQKPQPAHIAWDSHGLRIEASNSSLDQILHEVSVSTGVKIEGFSKDQRIFGTYGPGPAREVLSRLLDGSGYNVLMVGGLGNAPPSLIVLSAEKPSGPQPPRGVQNPQESEEDSVEAEEPQPQEQPQPMPIPQETPQPAPIANPFGGSQRGPMPMGGSPPMFGQPTPMPPDQNANPQQ